MRQCMESKSPEFIAIYGRRRIGKTYLVRHYFNDTFSFGFYRHLSRNKERAA